MSKVFIIIVNWNGFKDTLECLDSVCQLDYPKFEVIVVDNASVDDSVRSIRAAFPELTIIQNSENLGFTGGNNIAMRYAMDHGADYVWLLNNDAVVENDTLAKLIIAAEGSPGIGLVSPVVRYYYQPEKIQFQGSYVDKKNMTIVYPGDDCTSVAEEFIKGKNVCLWGTALLIKREVIEKIGYLSEKFFAYWEDTDYSMRAMRSNFSNIVVTTATIYHKTVPPKPGVSRRGNHFYYYIARNRYFWGIQHFKGLVRLSFQRRYFADLLRMYNMFCQGHISLAVTEAYLTGAGDALRNKSGRWDGMVKAPGWLKKLCSLLCAWHPFFWIDLLNGEIAKITSETFRRTRSKLLRF